MVSKDLLERLFPAFWSPRILYEDSDLFVIDKPAGVSTNAGGANRDDIVARLRKHLSERKPDAVPLDLIAHWPLERDTSGALVLVRNRVIHKTVLQAIERGEVSVTYIAAFIKNPIRAPHRSNRVAPQKSLSGRREGSIPSRMLQQQGARTLMELRPTRLTRAEPIRTHCAALGRPIAGDEQHGGEPAPRLLLHAHTIELPQFGSSSGSPPLRSSKRLRVTAPLPEDFTAWLEGPLGQGLPSTATELTKRFETAAQRRYGLALSDGTSAFRLGHERADGLPSVALDLYNDYAVLHLSSPQALAVREPLLDATQALGVRGVYLKVRPRQANTVNNTRRDDLAPSAPVRGEAAPNPLLITENGLRFIARLGDGLATGIYLDQRENRRLVRELSSGKKVLNLFAYTCPFTVSAAAGGAQKTVSVDISRTSLAWGEDNLRANDLYDARRHTFVAEDALLYLRRAAARKDRFDLIVLDPPSYATHKQGSFVAEEDYKTVTTAALSVLSPSGYLLACTNHRKITQAKFRQFVTIAARAANRSLGKVKELAMPVDFPAPFGSEGYLKSLLIRVQ